MTPKPLATQSPAQLHQSLVDAQFRLDEACAELMDLSRLGRSHTDNAYWWRTELTAAESALIAVQTALQYRRESADRARSAA